MDELSNTTSQKLLSIIPRLMKVFATSLRNKDSQLPITHYRVLRILDYAPMSLSQLSNLEGVSKASLCESINLMVERGLISKAKDTEDARKVVLTPTQLGKEQLQIIDAHLIQFVQEKFLQLSHEELKQISEGLIIIESTFLKRKEDV